MKIEVKESFRIPGTEIIIEKGQTLNIIEGKRLTDIQQNNLKKVEDYLNRKEAKHRIFSFNSQPEEERDAISFKCFVEFGENAPWDYTVLEVGINLDLSYAFTVDEMSFINGDYELEGSNFGEEEDYLQYYHDEIRYLAFGSVCSFKELTDCIENVIEVNQDITFEPSEEPDRQRY